jgi:CheY-like chemotaxis protein
MNVAELAEQILAEPRAQNVPLLFYLPPGTNPEQSTHWRQLAQEFHLHAIDSRSQLVEAAASALCIPLSSLPESAQSASHDSAEIEFVLNGKKVLIVDDDIRNIFALTSILERYDLVTVSAETGRDAINLLQAAPDVDIVLMDIMMPEMDGIDTMKAIRKIPHFAKLPIIAVTAKAMKGDREKCIEAGAWDYLSKPVDPDQLLMTLRAWLAV